MYYLQMFFASLQFITRIPVPARYAQSVAIDDYSKGVVTFPLVGLVVGLIGALVFGLIQLLWGAPLASIGVVLIGAVLTGGFHLDGLADTADGVFSSRPRARMLEIMRDSQIGSNGALALILVVGIYTLAIYRLTLTSGDVWLLIIAAPIISRTLAVVLLMFRQNCANENGLGHYYIGNVTTKNSYITLIIGTILVLALSGLSGLLSAALTGLFGLGYRAFINHKLGGQTGDTLGAGIVLFEVIFLLFLF